MKTKINRTRSSSGKYITPAVLVMMTALPTACHASGGAGNGVFWKCLSSCRNKCVSRTNLQGSCDRNFPYLPYCLTTGGHGPHFWRVITGPTHCTPPRLHNYILDLAVSDLAICVSHQSHPRLPNSHAGAQCHGTIVMGSNLADRHDRHDRHTRANYPVSSHTTLSRTYNLLATLSEPPLAGGPVLSYAIGADSHNALNMTGASSQFILGRITLSLVLKGLNEAPGGIQFKPGELLDASKLTIEQRRVLQDHMGLMKEAIRQIKAARPKHGSTPLEPATNGTVGETHTDTMEALR